MHAFLRGGLALFALFAMAIPAAAQAQQAGKTPPAIIVVVDSQRIFREAAALKSVRQQIDQYRASLKPEIEKQEDSLRKEDQELAKQRSILTPEAFEQKRQAFQGKVVTLQKQIQDHQTNIEKAFNAAREQVSREVVEILKDMSKARGFNMVLDRAHVQVMIEPVEITQDVLKALDQRLPTVKAALPARK
ncbi:OmpH family outer membrane protein [Ferrovibrio sp.]|uniref:OmpH family outer membrane protein n=1 Tax=Ferrovibrio sp. TaxID=1917215 RepID=UPI00311DE4EF